MNPAIAPPMIHPISALDTVNPRREFAAISDNPRGHDEVPVESADRPGDDGSIIAEEESSKSRDQRDFQSVCSFLCRRSFPSMSQEC